MGPLAFLLAFAAVCQAQQYYLQSSFSGPTFFDNFDFWTASDPTFGYVHYVDRGTAIANGMIDPNSGLARWDVEATQILDPYANLGRLSLRLTSVQSWTHGLFILDLEHMPPNQCGVWPAFWSLGSGVWPTTGEIDMIEFTNNQANNLMALHTSPEPNCSVAGIDQIGTLLTADCGHGDGYDGCGVSATTPNNIGDGFNAAGGGVYAMEWTSTSIKMWFFPRGQIPSSILQSNGLSAPDPSFFGVPLANFQGSCDFDTHFYNHSLIFNTDFCGSYAGNLWQAQGCPMLVPTNGWQSCNQYVALNPQAFQDSYWEVNYLNIYQTTPGAAATSSRPLSSVTPAIRTSSVSTALSGAQGRSSTPSGTPSLVTTTPISTPAAVSSALSSVSSVTSASSIAALATSSTLNFLPPPPTSLSDLANSAPLAMLASPSASSVATSMSTSDPGICTDAVCTATAVVVVVTTSVAGRKRELASVNAPMRVDDAIVASGEPTAVHPTAFSVNTPTAFGAYTSTAPPPIVPYVGPNSIVSVPPKRHDHEPIAVDNLDTPPVTAVKRIDTDKVVADPAERRAALPAEYDNGNGHLLPGGSIGDCGVPGQNCHIHNGGDGAIGHAASPARDGNAKVRADENNDLPDPTSFHVKDIVTVTTYVVASVRTIYRLPYTFQFFTYSPASTTEPLTARDVYETATLNDYTPTTFPYQPDCAWITVTGASAGESAGLIPYTPTTFPYEPDCTVITVMEPNVQPTILQPPGRLQDPRLKRDAPEPTLLSDIGIGDQKRSSGSTTAAVSSVTCTPVVSVGRDGEETRIGCQLPPAVLVTKSEPIIVANSTYTIYATTSTSDDGAMHVTEVVAILPQMKDSTLPTVAGPAAKASSASVHWFNPCLAIVAGAVATTAFLIWL